MLKSSLPRSLLLGLAMFPWGCAAPSAAESRPKAAPPPEATERAEPADSSAPPSQPSAAPAAAEATAPPLAPANGAGATETERAPAAPQAGTPLDARPADPNRSLPEIRVRQVGMHIGGGPNDVESKKPFLKAIERRNQEYLICYRLVKTPLQGGTFGVDLFVSAAGGVPEVRATRQRLGGSEFESCMVDAFNGVRFASPRKPTTLSYSMRFDVRDPSAPEAGSR